MANRVHREGNTIVEVAAATIQPGTFGFTASGIAKFYGTRGQDSQPIQAGDEAVAIVGGTTVLIDKVNATDVYAVGAEVYGNTTNQEAEATGPVDGVLGYAAEASANGDLQVAIRLTN